MFFINLNAFSIDGHFIISGVLLCTLYFLYNSIKSTTILYNLLLCLLIINFLSFNSYLFITGLFDYKTHLPLHLCYLTELGILIAIIFKNHFFYPWLVLNALGGGITGFTNSNLPSDALYIEYIHLYLSHFNLLLFSMILYLNKFVISKTDFIKSIIFNMLIFFGVFYLNTLFDSNYWFTQNRPPGINLTHLLPDWPYYLVGLISIGLISYYITFKIFLKNKKYN